MELKIDNVYDVTTLAPIALGGTYTHLKVVIEGMTSKQAIKFRDIHTMHSAVKGEIPGIPESVTDLKYVLFEDSNGDDLLLAIEYLDIFTIVNVEVTNVRIEIFDTGLTTVGVISTRLRELGITNFTIKTF